MADFDAVYTKQNEGFDAIWNIVQTALDDLKEASAGGYFFGLNAEPDPYYESSAVFDPEAPNQLLVKLPFDIEPLFVQIDGYIQRIANIQAPTFPDMPTVTMQDHEIWNEGFMDNLKTSLWDYVVSMGIPDKSYQDAIFNEDLERNVLILNDAFELADAKTGARGFTYPNDWGNSLKLDAQIKYTYDRTQVSRTIVKNLVEWARQNYQFAVTQGIEHQKAHMDFTIRYCLGYYEVYKALVIALLERFKAEIEAISAPVTLLAKQLDVFMDYAKLSLEADKTTETLKQSRRQVEISEVLDKYKADSARKTSELAQRLGALQGIVQYSASLAQATNMSVVAYTKKS